MTVPSPTASAATPWRPRPGRWGLQIMSSQRLGQIYYDLGDYHRAMTYFRSNVASLQGALLYERFDAGTLAPSLP